MPSPLACGARRAVPLFLAVLLVCGFSADSLAQMGSADFRGRAPQVIDSALLDFGGQPVYLYGLRGVGTDEAPN